MRCCRRLRVAREGGQGGGGCGAVVLYVVWCGMVRLCGVASRRVARRGAVWLAALRCVLSCCGNRSPVRCCAVVWGVVGCGGVRRGEGGDGTSSTGTKSCVKGKVIPPASVGHAALAPNWFWTSQWRRQDSIGEECLKIRTSCAGFQFKCYPTACYHCRTAYNHAYVQGRRPAVPWYHPITLLQKMGDVPV